MIWHHNLREAKGGFPGCVAATAQQVTEPARSSDRRFGLTPQNAPMHKDRTPARTAPLAQRSLQRAGHAHGREPVVLVGGRAPLNVLCTTHCRSSGHLPIPQPDRAPSVNLIEPSVWRPLNGRQINSIPMHFPQWRELTQFRHAVLQQ